MLSPGATSQERRLLHKAAVALLAVPILSAVYLGALVRRSVVPRIGLAIVVAGLLGVGVIGAGLPATTTARPPTPIVPLTQAAFQTTVVTGHDLDRPGRDLVLDADGPGLGGLGGDGRSADAGRSRPGTPPGGRSRSRPQIALVARARSTPCPCRPAPWPARASRWPQPARAAFLTRDATTSTIAPTDPIGDPRVGRLGLQRHLRTAGRSGHGGVGDQARSAHRRHARRSPARRRVRCSTRSTRRRRSRPARRTASAWPA